MQLTYTLSKSLQSNRRLVPHKAATPRWEKCAAKSTSRAQSKGHKAKYVAHCGGYHRVTGLADRLEENRIHLDNATNADKGQKNTHGLFTKFPVCIGIGDIARNTEKADDKVGEKFK